MIEISAASHPGSFRVDGDLTIYTAAQAKPALLALLHGSKGPEGLELDLRGIAEFDTAGLQVLMLLKNESRQIGHALRLVNHSACVLEVFDLINMAAFFGDPLLVEQDASSPTAS
ncbi:MAG: STAS domain-containing protein [Burkholderiaceae bacterium]|nr:STAS domain-containing protein [Roseateles sp.]MBV8471446.1 STAS domain-containing protein [Burkholderiaceae bacterium]